MEAHTASPGRPILPGRVRPQPRELRPRVTAVTRAEERSILDPGVNRVRIVRRGFQVPDPLEFPRVWSAIVSLVCAGDTLVRELVAHSLP